MAFLTCIKAMNRAVNQSVRTNENSLGLFSRIMVTPELLMNRFARNITFVLALGLAVLVTRAADSQTQTISLSGSWRFQLDRDDVGLRASWFARELRQSIHLPGSLPQQGIGDSPSLATKWTGGIQDPNWHLNPIYAPYAKSNDFHFPFWLQPEKYYVGAAWFRRDIDGSKAWAGKRVVLSLERPHWETRVWVD